MKMKIPACLLTFGMILTPATYADNLLDIYRLAIQNDPQIRAADADRLTRVEPANQARALLMPNLSVSADSVYNDQQVEASGGLFGGSTDEKFNSNSYTVKLTQPLLHFEYFFQLAQANATAAQAEADYLSAQQDLIMRVAEAYFNVLAAEDNLTFADAEKNAIGRQLDQAQKHYNVGLIAITDVHEAKAAYDLAVADEITAQNLLESTREALEEIIGEPNSELAALREDIDLLPPDPADMQQWVDMARNNNPAVLSASLAKNAAKEGIALNRSGHLPTLDLIATTGSSNRNGGYGGAQYSDTDTVGVQLNWPLFAGGAVNSRIRQASQRHVQAGELLIQRLRNVTRQTRDSFRGVTDDISRIHALDQAVASNQSALDATVVGFDAGTRTTVDILVSQRELYRAKRDYSRARYQYLLRTLKLKQAVGNLDIASVEQINAWLQ